jgi:hypothetical protein
MATTYKVLGQVVPLATTATDLYTVPAGTSTVCSTLAVCARGSTSTYRVAVRPAGATLADEHYIVYDNWVDGKDTIFLTLGLTLGANDVVTVYSSEATNTFSLFGSEIT